MLTNDKWGNSREDKLKEVCILATKLDIWSATDDVCPGFKVLRAQAKQSVVEDDALVQESKYFENILIGEDYREVEEKNSISGKAKFNSYEQKVSIHVTAAQRVRIDMRSMRDSFFRLWESGWADEQVLQDDWSGKLS